MMAKTWYSNQWTKPVTASLKPSEIAEMDSKLARLHAELDALCAQAPLSMVDRRNLAIHVYEGRIAQVKRKQNTCRPGPKPKGTK